MINPMSAGATWAASRAFRAAFAAMADVQSSASATWREWMPVWE